MMLYDAISCLWYIEVLLKGWYIGEMIEKLLRLWVRAKDVCFAASRSRCYGYIFGYFLSVIRNWN